MWGTLANAGFLPLTLAWDACVTANATCFPTLDTPVTRITTPDQKDKNSLLFPGYGTNGFEI